MINKFFIFLLLFCLLGLPAIYAQDAANQEKDSARIMSLADNLIAHCKSACIEQGGCGPLQAFIGNIAAWFQMENTIHISRYSKVKQAAAMAFARELVGDNPQLIEISYKSNLETLPDPSFTEEQSGTVLANKIILLISPKTEAETKVIDEAIAIKFKNIKPDKTLDLDGNSHQPQTNSLSRFFFGNKEA